MWHYYKVPTSCGYQLEEHPQEMSMLEEYKLTEKEYNAELTAMKERAEKRRAEIAAYAERVDSGEIDLEDVPEEYREEIKAMQAQDPEQALIDEIIQEVKRDE